MSEEKVRAQTHSNYTAEPSVPPELMPRLAAIIEVLSGAKTMSEAARQLDLSRNHFQSILHRALGAMVQTLSPKEAGRPPKPQELNELQRRIKALERQNARLSKRLEATDELFTVARDLLHGGRQSGQRARRTRKKGATEEPTDAEGDSHARVLAMVERMHELGVTRRCAAHLAGVDAATLRRWRRPSGAARTRARAPSAEIIERAEALVRNLQGLVGAAALSHRVGNLSRRAAARIKAATLTAMERERKDALSRVRVSVPGVMRGMDAMHLRTADGVRYALISADAAVPYRTSALVDEHYDARVVARLITLDIERHGAPLVLRMDRARAHETPEVLQILKNHQIRLLHGPPHCPRFYGQLERQNREHRAWLARQTPLTGAFIEPLLKEMLDQLNTLWARRSLGWATAAQAWTTRMPISLALRDRFNEEVHDRTQRIACTMNVRGAPADLPERLAIEQTLHHMGYLQQYRGR